MKLYTYTCYTIYYNFWPFFYIVINEYCVEDAATAADLTSVFIVNPPEYTKCTSRIWAPVALSSLLNCLPMTWVATEEPANLPIGPPVPVAGGPHHGYGSLHLPEFWPNTTSGWFPHTKSKFRLKHTRQSGTSTITWWGPSWGPASASSWNYLRILTTIGRT